MCVGIPMQITAVTTGFADCEGRGESKRVSTVLIGNCSPGDWVLTFLSDARELISASRAAEINEVLDMLQTVFDGSDDLAPLNFSLPSSMSATEMAALSGHKPDLAH